MEELAVRLAKKEDLPEILPIFAYARAFMAAQGNGSQWGQTNPPLEILEGDIRKGQLYVLTRHDRICGVFAFVLGEDPTYGYIEGGWNSSQPYGTIHRVAGNGTEKGIFAACVNFCRKQCAYLRIDTHQDNKIMRHLIRKQGFSYCGVIYVKDGSPRLAFDRIE